MSKGTAMSKAGRLVIAGLGYSGVAVAREAMAAGWQVVGTARDPAAKPVPEGVEVVAFGAAGAAIRDASHLLVTAAPGEASSQVGPDETGDPVLAAHRDAIEAAIAAGSLVWVGYCSTTGVYGDRGGGAVDEASAPAPGSARARRRVAAERAWAGFADRCAVDVMRLAGIYGPGRSALETVRAGRARRIDKPGHKFSRIHVDDIAHGVVAAMRTAARTGLRVLNFADDEPASSADVTAYAARLLGLEPPPLVPFDEAVQGMSEMARSFWAENRVVLNDATKQALRIAWHHPSYREGLKAIQVEI